MVGLGQASFIRTRKSATISRFACRNFAPRFVDIQPRKERSSRRTPSLSEIDRPLASNCLGASNGHLSAFRSFGKLHALRAAIVFGAAKLFSIWRIGLPPRSRTSLAFAVICVAVATLVRLALGFVSPDSTVFATYYSATLVAALVGGATAGGFAAALGGAVALALFVPPDWGFAQFRLEQIVSATLFIGSSIIIIAAAESYRGLLARLREEKASRELLTHELNHRVKNIAASVQGILHQTLRNDKEDRDRAIARVTALLATNAILVKSNWRGAAFRDILAQEMRPYDGSFFQICGNDFDCSPDLAAFLALGVHELITNAVKYGALSRPGGTVKLNWESVQRVLRLDWIESGGPSPRECVTKGFGTKLLQTGARRFGGSVQMAFHTDGLRVHLTLQIPECGTESW